MTHLSYNGPLAVCHEWKTRDGRVHYCTGSRGNRPHKRHRCDCGSWTHHREGDTPDG